MSVLDWIQEQIPSLFFPILSEPADKTPNFEELEESCLDSLDDEVDLLYIWGLPGFSTLERLIVWKKAKPSRLLVLVESHLGKVVPFLEQLQVRGLLSKDLLFTIEVLKEGAIHRWAKMRPRDRLEVVALLSYRDSEYKAIRQQLLEATALSHALLQDRLQGHQLFQQFLDTISILPTSFYANRWKDAFRGVPAVICGAGPSLEEALPWIRELAASPASALVITGGSALPVLSRHGIWPHFGVAVDPNLEEYRRLKHYTGFEVPFLYATRLFPACFQTVSGPFGFMHSGVGGMWDFWLSEALGMNEPLLGSVLEEGSMSVTALCLSWAHLLGCSPLILAGVDLAYVQGKHYAQGAVASGTEVTIKQSLSAADRLVKVYDRSGQDLYTANRWLMEARAYDQWARTLHRGQIFTLSEQGLVIQAIPPCSLQEATLKTPHLPSRSLRQEIASWVDRTWMSDETQAVLATKYRELQEGIDRIEAHLEVMVGKKSGSLILAEIELEEDPIFQMLFYDRTWQAQATGRDVWLLLYDQILLYRRAIQTSTSPSSWIAKVSSSIK
jgi:hypothetical protein